MICVKEAIQNVVFFNSTLRMQIQPLNSLQTVSKVGDLSSTIAMTAHCFGALSQVRAIGHCVIGQERDLFSPAWLNWWLFPWVPAFEIKKFPHTLKPWNSRASVGNTYFHGFLSDEITHPCPKWNGGSTNPSLNMLNEENMFKMVGGKISAAYKWHVDTQSVLKHLYSYLQISPKYVVTY